MGERLKNKRDEISGIAGLGIGIFISISLLTYNRWDPSPFTLTDQKTENYGGIAGAYLADIFISIFGASSFLIPVFLLIFSLKRIMRKEDNRLNIIGFILLLTAVSMLCTLTTSSFNLATIPIKGGMIGTTLAVPLKTLLSPFGAYIIVILLLTISLIILGLLDIASIISSKKVTRQEFVIKSSGKHVRTPNIGSKPTIATEKPKEEKVVQETIKPVTQIPRPQQGIYMLPPLDFLKPPANRDLLPTKDELLSDAEILQSKLSDFGVTGTIMQIHPGPVITMFEFEPSPGVKISKIVALSDDLGRAMGGLKVRVTLIPGKTPIGIEVPNKKRAVVSQREIIDSDSFKKRTSLLSLTLGKDIYGSPVTEDLAKMPHLLVAGTTGSGKSVSVNSMIMSILYKAKPNEVKMLMIDPKLLELSIYEGIPHLISPVITNPKEATEALKKMVMEMDRRYRLIADSGARNIETFNVSADESSRLPYIVIIIDELADLMFTSAKNVEDSIVRLAQMARAAGIHLILATQRPSVDVITGIIKANFPSRIAFQVSSKVDSRTILDTHGAEKLLGKGDMLVLNPGARIVRVHGAYVSEDEINAVTEFIKTQEKPDYSLMERLIIKDETEPVRNESGERDELYEDVIKYAQYMGEISISSIQRKFKIGYNRAAVIMDMLETDCLVGPSKGAGKPRSYTG